MSNYNDVVKVIGYKFQNKEFDSIDKVKLYVENKIGAIIDSIDNSHCYNPAQKLAIFNMIVGNKGALTTLLNVEITADDCQIVRFDDVNLLD